uniref:glycoside hydrolase family 16 protein n=1 Tax=Streptomyces sp. SM12 TaxID=1071602 RepID=UPI0015E16C40
AADERSAAPGAVLFDDFDYTAHDDPRLRQNGWIVKSGDGGPGLADAVWTPENVTFQHGAGSSVLNLEAGTDGTEAGTEQSELFTAGMKFTEGTYAARVRFSDEPRFGPDGDRVVQTFFSINDLTAPMAPDYAEYDFEYLPNGGWGESGNVMFTTSWETYQPDPWLSDNESTADRASYAGWHDLVFTIDDTEIVYWIDGERFATHGAYYLPERPMSINVNQWFIDLEGLDSDQPRAYDQQVDYVYYAEGVVLGPEEVRAEVEALRADGVAFRDTVG